jgi:hypothetical protein
LRPGQHWCLFSLAPDEQRFPEDEFDGRSIIGICKTWFELTSCNPYFCPLTQHVKYGVLEAGCVSPWIFRSLSRRSNHAAHGHANWLRSATATSERPRQPLRSSVCPNGRANQIRCWKPAPRLRGYRHHDAVLQTSGAARGWTCFGKLESTSMTQEELHAPCGAYL